MSRGVVAVCLTLVALLMVVDRRGSSAEDASPEVAKRLVSVGKTYEFSFGALAAVRCRVLEEPRDNWIRVEYLDRQAKPTKGWVHLDLVMIIEERD
jgi:hypothetical protein